MLRAVKAATEWAGGAPLIFGGDLNLRPAETPAIFDHLREEFGLAAPTAPRAIDHLLVRGLEVLEPPVAWAPERRELPLDGPRPAALRPRPGRGQIRRRRATGAPDLR